MKEYKKPTLRIVATHVQKMLALSSTEKYSTDNKQYGNERRSSIWDNGYE